MINLNIKQKLIILVIFLIIVLVISYYIFQRIQTSNYEDIEIEDFVDMQNEEAENSINSQSVDIDDEENIIVHIAGSVKKNGIIITKENSRISDIISLAGGLTEDADISDVNLAYKVEDGQKIYIPSIAEKETLEHYITKDAGEDIATQGSATEKITININTANQTELEMLPGVGPSTAANIIKYREENGKFKQIEDIKNIPGIGDSKFESLKDYIKVK